MSREGHEEAQRVLVDSVGAGRGTIFCALFCTPIFAFCGCCAAAFAAKKKSASISVNQWQKKKKIFPVPFLMILLILILAVLVSAADENEIESIIIQAREYRETGRFKKAQQLLEMAISSFPREEHQKTLKIELADVHLWWAKAFGKENDYVNALKHREKAYNINKKYRPKGVATNLGNIGYLYDVLGQKHKALDNCKKALSILREEGDRVGEATIHNNIGKVYADLAQYQKAIEHYEKALSIRNIMWDRAGEAITLSNIGYVYNVLGRRHEALQYYKKALTIERELGERIGEAVTLTKIGKIYRALGHLQKTLGYYEKALPILQKLRRRAEEASTLSNIGGVYCDLGQRRRGMKYIEKALRIHQTIGNRGEEATCLNNLGKGYVDLGYGHKGLELFKKALLILQKEGDHFGEAATLNNIGIVYSNLGQKQKALENLEKALPIRRTIGDRTGVAGTLQNIGTVYLSFGRKQKALEYFEEALPICRAMGDRVGEGTILSNIGVVYSEFGENSKALEFYEKALSIRKAVWDKAGEAVTLTNIGVVYSDLGQMHQALKYCENALLIHKEVRDRDGEAITLNNLMHSWESLGNKQFSIFYGKQSVNAYQNLRANISALDKEIKQGYLKIKKNTYRFLADLLVDEGRIPEAQHVLDMLKEEEFYQFIRRDRADMSPTYAQLDFNSFEKKWLEKYNEVIEHFADVGSEYYLLKNKGEKTEAEKKRMQQLEASLESSRKAYHEYLTRLKKAFAEHDENIKKGKYEALTLTEHARALQTTLRDLDKKENCKTAALHYLVYGGRVTVILTTPDSQMVKSGKIEEKKLNRMIFRYRKAVRDTLEPIGVTTGTSVSPSLHRELYNIIFKPIDEELKKYGATNLMIFLDSVLRYIPLSALWDGETYLVQRYRMTVFTTSSLPRIQLEPNETKKILGFGASQGGCGFLPLSNVEEEIRNIVKDKEKGYNGLISGKALLDSDFTKNTFVNLIKAEVYPLVHIASHFKFSPGDETKNFLLMGDGSRMNLAELRYKGNLFHNVELLMLAACETGVGGGNGQEIDGFGELAQKSGARAVVATLWKVRDKSTKELMVAFYKHLKDGNVTSKIEALRQAQLELAGLDDRLSKNHRKPRKKTKYSHPYYWGPFIMMGNWR